MQLNDFVAPVTVLTRMGQPVARLTMHKVKEQYASNGDWNVSSAEVPILRQVLDGNLKIRPGFLKLRKKMRGAEVVMCTGDALRVGNLDDDRMARSGGVLRVSSLTTCYGVRRCRVVRDDDMVIAIGVMLEQPQDAREPVDDLLLLHTAVGVERLW